MDYLTFITKIVEFAAWPIAAFLIALCLRKELQVLIPLIKKFKAGLVELELGEIQQELKSTKSLTEAVAAKFDEGDGNADAEPQVQAAVSRDTSALSKAEVQILKAMCESRFATRSINGVAKDTGLSKATVQATYGGLISKGLVEQTKNKEGQLRWYATALGRAVASES